MDNLRTVRDLVRWGMTTLNKSGVWVGHGAADALEESSHLVQRALALPHDLPGHFMDAAVTDEEKAEILGLFRRRVEERIPSAYITRSAWFGGLEFYVDERVLVPRSPIAELIAHQFEPWLHAESVTHILDLCTGSGCIGIACAMAFPDADIDISDVSADALAVARKNVDRFELEDQVTVWQSNLFGDLPRRTYDLVVSNPPYVDRSELEAMPREFHHEPVLGLAAGEDGLDVVLPLLAQAAEWLTPDGVLVVEVGASAGALEALLPDVPFIWVDFEHGGDGVFILRRQDLLAHAEDLRRVAADRPRVR